MRTATLVMASALVLAGSGCAREPRQPLKSVYTPSFASIPPSEGLTKTIEKLADDWRHEPGKRVREDIFSIQGLCAGVAGAVVLLVAFDWRRLRNPRNVDTVVMLAIGLCLFDVMRFFSSLVTPASYPAYVTLLEWVFDAVVALSLVLLVRALLRSVRPATEPWRPNLPATVLAGLTIALLAANFFLLFTRPPDDAGWFVNLGAQRLRERGRLPYGDPLLTGTPAAAYGPLLYAAHVPFQVIASPTPVNPSSPARPTLGPASEYYLPPTIATTMCTATFHLVGVVALWWIGLRMRDTRTAWALTSLYCGSLAILGIGGQVYEVAGITFISHIAPASAVLLSFAALPYPSFSGVLLAVSAGLGFYPAFMAPAWLGYYWNDRSARVRFAVAFAVTCAAIGLSVYVLSQPTAELSRVATIVRDTFGHHTDPEGYGRSPFGFWGQRTGIRRWLAAPLADSGFTSPAWLMFASLVGGAFFLTRGRPAVTLALGSGAVAIGATLVKPHATGTYMAWYYGLLLIGFFAGSAKIGGLAARFTSSQQRV